MAAGLSLGWGPCRSGCAPVAAAVLRGRLRRDLRERMGASYSPVAFYRAMPAENGYSLMQVEPAPGRGK